MNQILNIKYFYNQSRLYSRTEILAKPCPIPKSPGIYAWFFKNFPLDIPTSGCVIVDGITLLYVGISPKKPQENGIWTSRQSLFNRIRYHYIGNAEGSTLRLTLGVLLQNELGIELRRVGSGKRMTFGYAGEKLLSDWMDKNAYINWGLCSAPWIMEKELIRDLSLPLNLDQNRHHCFHQVLSEKRKVAKARARELPVLE